MDYLSKYMLPLQNYYKNKTFIWQKDKTGFFERILCDGETIMELERYYKAPLDENGIVDTSKKEIDPDKGYIVLYFFNSGHKNAYKFGEFEVEDPYIEDRKVDNKIHLSLTGSEWVISQCIPLLFETDATAIEKLKNSLQKQNKILGDFV